MRGRVFMITHFPPIPCPNFGGRNDRRSLGLPHEEIDPRYHGSGDADQRRVIQRPLFCRRPLDRHLLPAVLSCATSKARECSLLSVARRSYRRRSARMQALSRRSVSAQPTGMALSADRASSRASGGTDDRTPPGRDRGSECLYHSPTFQRDAWPHAAGVSSKTKIGARERIADFGA